MPPKGIALVPVVVEIFLCARKYEPVPDGMNKRMHTFREDKQAAAKALMDRLLEDTK